MKISAMPDFLYLLEGWFNTIRHTIKLFCIVVGENEGEIRKIKNNLNILKTQQYSLAS